MSVTTEQKLILYVDDEKQRCRFHAECAKCDNQGWEFEWAESVEEAVCKVAEKRYDLVVLDLKMPPAAAALGCPVGGAFDTWRAQLFADATYLSWLMTNLKEEVDPKDERLAGYAFLRWLRSPTRPNTDLTPRNVPILIVSAVPDDDYRQMVELDQRIRPRVIKFLFKPVNVDHFINALKGGLSDGVPQH